LFFRYINSRVWSQSGSGHFNKALAKGPKTTTWIWNLHADAHDFQQSSSESTAGSVGAKVFSSGLAHISIVFFWLGGMHFHGAYFSNYSAWLKDPKTPGAQLVWSLVGQDIMNQDLGGYFQSIRITSGFFQLWRSEGIVTQVHLKYAAAAALIGTIVTLWAAYFHMHISWSTSLRTLGSLSSYNYGQLCILAGLGSISWAGHQIHIALPINRLLDSGVDPSQLPTPQDLLFKDLMQVIFPGFGVGPLVDFSVYLNQKGAAAEVGLNPSTGSIYLGQIASHHFFVGVTLILSGVIFLLIKRSKGGNLTGQVSAAFQNSWHSRLSLNLAIAGSLSITFAHHIYAMPVYPFCGNDYATVLCLFVHHMWIGGFFIVGAGAHAAIYMVRDEGVPSGVALGNKKVYAVNSVVQQLLGHRDIIMGHLIWVTIALGMHAFGMYIHNDTLQALGRPEDLFSDNAIQLRPLFAVWVQSLPSLFLLNALSGDAAVTGIPGFGLEVLDGKVVTMTQELGTADFMVHHIHAFTIHCTLLILMKGVLYSRSSRLVSDKLELGFRYPCDGPGRGGTCQISPWDHVFLGIFWMYNTLSVVIFHFFWKMQSDVWGKYDAATQKIVHVTGGDFSVNSITINGWLRNFLWSQSAEVIQSYGSGLSGYGLIFLGAHFTWAFSLMFLWSGRGYWQELIESILWAHQKLKIVPNIQPRALSITQGRAVGVTHYILGGIGCTWSFFISRVVALSIS
jgi:photosystem I P700 chlorophyll a apoprotein A1